MDKPSNCNGYLPLNTMQSEQKLEKLFNDVESLKESIAEIRQFIGLRSQTDNNFSRESSVLRSSEDTSTLPASDNHGNEIKNHKNRRKKKAEQTRPCTTLRDDTNSFIMPRSHSQKHVAKPRINENVYNILITYAMESTYHGLRYVFGRDVTPVRRMLWLLVCIVSYLAFLNLCGLAISRYLSYPVSSTIKQHYVPALQFPALTICNNNRWRKSKYTEMVQNGSVPDILGVFASRHETEGTTDKNYGSDDVESNKRERRSDNQQSNAINWENFLRDVGHQFNDMVKKQEFFEVHAGVAHNITLNVTSFILAQDARVCHRVTFHNVSTGKLLESTVAEQLIELQLDPQKSEYMQGGDADLIGFYVSFHTPHTFPTSTNLVPLMNINRYHEVKVIKNVEKNLPLPYGNSDCKVSKNGTREYSQNMCKLKCMSEIMYEECGCRSIGYPGKTSKYPTIPLCDTPHVWAPDMCIANLHLMDKCLHCDPPCERTKYDVKINSYGTPEEYLGLYLYFNDYAYTVIEQQAVYPMASLFGDLGGYLGLLIGASVMSLFELLDLVCRIIAISLTRGVSRIGKHKSARKVTTNEETDWM